MRYAADAVVVGAGVIGSAIAFELARAGRDVLVVDKGPGPGFGSTSASSAIIRFHYSTHTGVAAAWESRQLWEDWGGHLGHCEDLARFVRTGMLVIDSAPGPATDLLDAVGVPWEMWDSDQIERRVPGSDAGRFGPPAKVDSPEFFADARGRVAGTFTPDAGYVDDPRLAAQNLAVAARQHGATFLLRREVVAVGTGPRQWQLQTADGDILDADVVVNAAGPWSSAFNRLAGTDADFTVTSRPLRQEVHPLPGPSPSVAVADPDLGIYVRPDSGGLMVGGMEPECDPLEWLTAPEDADPRPTRTGYEAQTWRAARRFPNLSVPNRARGIVGVYDVTTDWAPIYDRVEAPAFYVAMGTSGNQFKNAPVVGQLMRHLIDAVEAGHDHDAHPLSFTCERTGAVLDLATWSRKRRVDPNPPSNVMG